MRGKIVLFGDSITQLSFSASLSGWGAHLADVYQRRVDVYNRGFSGYNTEWFLNYARTMEGQLDIWGIQNKNDESDSVKLVTIFFGANDASDAILNPRQHVPMNRFQSNLREIVDLCRQHYGDNIRILFIAPPPVHHESRLQYQIERYGVEKATGKLERTLELSGLYANLVCQVADELELPCLNLWKEMQQACTDHEPMESVTGSDISRSNEPWSKYLIDGLHLSKLGNEFVAHRLVQMIHQYYPDVAVHPCPKTGNTANSSSSSGKALFHSFGVAAGPWHDDIDPLDSQGIFDRRCS